MALLRKAFVFAASMGFAAPVFGAGVAEAPSNIDALRLLLGASDENQAVEAAGKLAKSNDPEAVEALLDGLAIGAGPRVQAALIDGLAARKDARAIQILSFYAGTRNVEVRRRAVTALAGIPSEKVVPTLLERLGDAAPEVRQAAASGLAVRREKSAEPRLWKLLLRKDPAAPSALAALATPEMAHKLSELLGQVPDNLIVQAFGDILKRPDFGPDPVRLEIVKTLAKIPGVDSTTTLIEYVAASEKDKARPSRAEAQKVVDDRSGGQ